MLKPTRTVLALTAGSLVLGLVSAGAAIADEDPMAEIPAHHEHGSVKRQVWGKVVSSGRLTIRSKPSTRSYSLGKIESGRRIALECKQRGESVNGNDLWYLLDNRKDRDEWNDGNNGRDDFNDGREDGREDGRDDFNDGRDGEGKAVKKASKKDRDYGWVAARYVKNLDTVPWCR
ncbi:hypothetical protein [Streptomyces sp. A1136]|uniref:hypothetical protein n=1 Tax=Streptomyces sp. A1136 TaxID=2563102 RepID=UPI00109EBD5C|nr:hypothetical protein [Streptomyces sp. A1136]THA57518.1 hypothetical protein E6R62_06545 [Streptomyces sp. A1136]